MARLYLDYNASTPIDEDVVAVMRPLLMDDYGNPSSGHWAAAPAKAALDTARAQVAALLGCASDEIVFTSGGSEANNLALKGLCGTPSRRSDTRHHVGGRAPGDPGAMPPPRQVRRNGYVCPG